MEKKKSPLLYRMIKKAVRICYKKREVIGIENLPTTPSLIISNHAQLHGPITIELDFPGNRYTWCIGQMMKLKEVPSYAFQDFWSKKPWWSRWIFKIISYLIAPLSSYIFTHANTIAVYKDSRVMSTFKETVNKLHDGANVVIFPECEKEFNNIVNDFQTRFVDVAKLYYKKYQVELDFVPLYIAKNLKKMVLGKPIKYNHELDIDEQREVICNYLKEEITRIAKELPRHKVVPYGNIKKKNYPYSK